MSGRDEALRRFLLASSDLPFVYGERDCALWVCDWIVACGHADPGERFRGRYRDQRGCAQLLAREGGLLALASRAFTGVGLFRLDDAFPVPGDVACLATPSGQALALAAFAGRFAWKGDGGLVVTAAHPVLRAWRV